MQSHFIVPSTRSKRRLRTVRVSTFWPCKIKVDMLFFEPAKEQNENDYRNNEIASEPHKHLSVDTL